MGRVKRRKPIEQRRIHNIGIRCTKSEWLMIKGWARSKRMTVTDAIIGVIRDDCREIGGQ